ncbi:MAG: hypothetical protein IV100_12590 [Myxococcales bacterium]|nr:hypothetical protein [Myxococcales bacterium]
MASLFAGIDDWKASVYQSYWGHAQNHELTREAFAAEMVQALNAPADQVTPGELRRKEIRKQKVAAEATKADRMAKRAARGGTQ